MKKMWTETKVGRITLPHRLAMAPMTRSRANVDGTPGELAELYYSQRASMGLLISEGTQPSEDGQGYLWTPGLYNQAQIDGWKKVTNAVHEKGAYMYIQLMHAGRMSHPENTPHHRQGVAPSAIAPGVQIVTEKGMQDIPVPHELTKEEINTTILDFKKAAAAAIEAGADGVEIHGANGYLIQQFFAESSNKREDEYGGSIENRARFGIEVAKAVAEEIGADRTGFRISPGDIANMGIFEGEQSEDFYRYLVPELAKLNLAYLHVKHSSNDELLTEIRRMWPNALLVNRAGRPLEKIDVDIEEGRADVAPVGAWSLANPDLVERLQQDASLNEPDRSTYFGGDSRGYTDYTTMSYQSL
ncbi:alkene reductase [Bacillus massiliigorillae]|uniref:alkene reductase n=1 Tax=Bacillus massiliigorillae TaxID=1243664 RepID=UPI0003A96F49|nr:alkene reductase [Bacillus massiliigorillae]